MFLMLHFDEENPIKYEFDDNCSYKNSNFVKIFISSEMLEKNAYQFYTNMKYSTKRILTCKYNEF